MVHLVVYFASAKESEMPFNNTTNCKACSERVLFSLGLLKSIHELFLTKLLVTSFSLLSLMGLS